MTYRTLPSAALLAVTLTALTAACETTTYDGDGDAVADAATAPDAGSRKDAAAPGPTDALDGATADATPDEETDAEFDGAVLNDAASDGQVPVDGGPIDSGTADAGAPVTIAIGALPADASYRRSAYVQGIPPTSNMCISPPLYVPFQGTGDPRTCCYVAQQRVYPNAARIVLKTGRRVCLESGAASTCGILDARAPGVASASLTDNTALTAVFKAWGMVMFGSSSPALTLDRSSVTVTPSADGTRAKAVFKVQTGWEWGPGCKRGEGSWMHETRDVPLVPVP